MGFALGTDRIGSGNNIPITNSGQALGARFKNNQLRAAFWSPSLLVSTGDGVSSETIYFVVGKFTWSSTNDIVEVYNVGTDMVLGSPSSTYTTSENVDQTQFDTVSFGSKAADPYHEIDEIRFGPTFESVLNLPPPPGTVIIFK